MISLAVGHLDVPEGVLPTDRVRPDGIVIYSLTAHAICAIDRHKWIESEHAHHNLGHNAVTDWVDRYWKGWTRAKLTEHLYGWRCWGAFPEDDFGLLSRHTVEYNVSREVLRHVATMLADGFENLDIINWAVRTDQELDSILWLLDRIDINAKRQRLLSDHIRLFTEHLS
jgi:hypothetical protein